MFSTCFMQVKLLYTGSKLKKGSDLECTSFYYTEDLSNHLQL